MAKRKYTFHSVNWQDLTGQTFGAWTAVKFNDSTKKWKCVCACRIEREVRAGNLTGGKSKSCGCERVYEYTPKIKTDGRDGAKSTRKKPKVYLFEDLVGRTYGSLLVIARRPKGRWRCACSCGAGKCRKEITVEGARLRDKTATGCLGMELDREDEIIARRAEGAEWREIQEGITKHGMEYMAWVELRERMKAGGQPFPRKWGKPEYFIPYVKAARGAMNPPRDDWRGNDILIPISDRHGHTLPDKTPNLQWRNTMPLENLNTHLTASASAAKLFMYKAIDDEPDSAEGYW